MATHDDWRDELFLVVRRGDPANQEQAVDVYVFDDEPLLRALGSLIAKRLGGRPLTAPAPQPLHPVRTTPEGEP
jgi:hypothetical protein